MPDMAALKISLDKSGGKLLSNELAEWLKDAIRRGEFGPGSVLPGSQVLATAASVGENTARRALAILAEEGWAMPKRHIGSVVRQQGLNTLTRKRVLFYTVDQYYCYYIAQMISSVRSGLIKSGIDASMASVCGVSGENECIQLESFLKERWDLVLEIGASRRPRQMIESSGWSFVCIYDGIRRSPSASPNCVGEANYWTGAALGDFARACAKKGIKTVLQVLGLPNPYDVTDMLAVSNIEVRTLRVKNPGNPEAVSHGGFHAVRDFFRSWSGKTLPDLVLFTDDYVAQGGLIAMKSLGLSIPEDIAVVSHANKGHGPVWEKPLTRMEMDPERHGAKLAKAISRHLAGKGFPENLTLGSVWHKGETF